MSCFLCEDCAANTYALCNAAFYGGTRWHESDVHGARARAAVKRRKVVVESPHLRWMRHFRRLYGLSRRLMLISAKKGSHAATFIAQNENIDMALFDGDFIVHAIPADMGMDAIKQGCPSYAAGAILLTSKSADNWLVVEYLDEIHVKLSAIDPVAQR
jgi:hypothetical protein